MKGLSLKIVDLCGKNRVFLISALIGMVIFILIYGTYILNPCYVDWLLKGGDLSQHYLGWKYFREASWTFPVGLMNNASYPFYSSIIFTDSIPVFAVFFKLLSPVLPEKFQYFGLWGIMCFALQGGLSSLILKKYLKDDFEAVISSIFFVFSPVVLHRMFGHTSLAGNWLILLGILYIVYYNEKFSDYKKAALAWGITGFLCVGVHMYYAAMLGIVLLGFLLKEIYNNKRIMNIICPLFSYLICSASAVYIYGGFEEGLSQASAGGLGRYGFNLNGFFNPFDTSDILKELPIAFGTITERYTYLGLGIIILLFVSIVYILGSYNFKKIGGNKILSRHMDIKPYLLISLVSIFAALSPKATAGETIIYELQIPEFIENIWRTFRATGRLVWPAVYILMIFAVCSCRKYFNRQTFIVMIILCLFVQVYDRHTIMKNKNKHFNQKVEYETILKNSKWYDIAEIDEIKHIMFSRKILEKLGDYTDLVYAFAEFATDNHITTNVFWFAHTDTEKFDKLYEEVDKSLESISDDTLFIFTEEEKPQLDKYDLHYYELDGIIVGYKNEI